MQKFRGYKGNIYEYVGKAKYGLNLKDDYVIYRRDGEEELFVLKQSVWDGYVDCNGTKVKRFTAITEEPEKTSPKKILQKYFGYGEFKGKQEEVINQILSGRDVMCVMATGAGKSLCYQIPAMIFDGLTIVISPLISLMADQVNALKDCGISAEYLNSTVDDEKYKEIRNRLLSKDIKLLYVAPERLKIPTFVELMQQLDVSMVAVDEAHCVSQWGYDFRQSYLKIPDFIRKLNKRPIVGAFTATATIKVRNDICERLQLNDPYVITTGFDRPNLFFSVINAKDKEATIKNIIDKHPDESGIIYCGTKKAVDKLTAKLQEQGYSATRFHADLSPAEKEANQAAFLNDEKQIMVATVAFGMGIDKPNVRYVIHYHTPKSLEEYYQEAGRAGRDGEPSECVLLYSAQDVAISLSKIKQSDYNPLLTEAELQDYVEDEHKRLRMMIHYAASVDCLRRNIIRYFGDPAELQCDNCSNCLKQYNVVDITRDARLIIDCVRDLRGKFGVGKIADVLHGSRAQDILNWHFDELNSYGVLSSVPIDQIKREINTLIALEYLNQSTDERPTVCLNRNSRLLHEQPDITIPMRDYDQIGHARNIQSSAVTTTLSPDEKLYKALREYRLNQARIHNLPAFTIFHDKTLAELSSYKPTNDKELLKINGIGEAKLAQYGQDLLEIIQKYK